MAVSNRPRPAAAGVKLSMPCSLTLNHRRPAVHEKWSLLLCPLAALYHIRTSPLCLHLWASLPRIAWDLLPPLALETLKLLHRHSPAIMGPAPAAPACRSARRRPTPHTPPRAHRPPPAAAALPAHAHPSPAPTKPPRTMPCIISRSSHTVVCLHGMQGTWPMLHDSRSDEASQNISPQLQAPVIVQRCLTLHGLHGHRALRSHTCFSRCWSQSPVDKHYKREPQPVPGCRPCVLGLSAVGSTPLDLLHLPLLQPPRLPGCLRSLCHSQRRSGSAGCLLARLQHLLDGVQAPAVCSSAFEAVGVWANMRCASHNCTASQLHTARHHSTRAANRHQSTAAQLHSCRGVYWASQAASQLMRAGAHPHIPGGAPPDVPCGEGAPRAVDVNAACAAPMEVAEMPGSTLSARSRPTPCGCTRLDTH